jgi:putative ABC transport system permease protein
VSVEAAHRFWPSGEPIGARIALDATAGREAWLQVVGIVDNVRNSDIDQGPRAQVYVPMSRQPVRDLAVVVKSSSDPLPLVPAIRADVARIDSDQPIHDVATMSRVLFDDLASTYVLATLLVAIGIVALSLSAAGIYGIVSYTVVQRRREIGVRLALGAQPSEIVRMIITQAARPVVAGSVVGLVVAVAIAMAMASALPEVDARNPLNYMGVMLAIAAVTFAASFLPARRAAAINPLATLREE